MRNLKKDVAPVLVSYSIEIELRYLLKSLLINSSSYTKGARFFSEIHKLFHLHLVQTHPGF